MELILMVNLTFSIVGFFFIFRMWREVKSRRDTYGENFNIPRGRSQEPQMSQTVDMQQLAAMVAQNVREPETAPEPPKAEVLPMPEDGDLQRIVAAVIAAQKGGA